jgi:hypothetical protein
MTESSRRRRPRAHGWPTVGDTKFFSGAYDWFSFIGMGAFGTLLTIAVALAIFRILYRISGRFWVAWVLSIVVYAAFLFNIAPRPVFFSVILFTITLTQLFAAQRSGRAQSLCWLPLIFLVWASIHIQFIYGLAVVGLFAGVNLLQQIGRRWGIVPEFLQTPTLPILAPFVVLAGCLLAACAGPYSYHLYQEAFVISQSKIIYKIIRELQALSFEYFNQYLELLLAGRRLFCHWLEEEDRSVQGRAADLGHDLRISHVARCVVSLRSSGRDHSGLPPRRRKHLSAPYGPQNGPRSRLQASCYF